jgi:hypothetical protein
MRYSAGMVKSTGNSELFQCNTPAAFCSESGRFCTRRNAWNAGTPTYLALDTSLVQSYKMTEHMLLCYFHEEDTTAFQADSEVF